jgi:rhodanese-related sulfurtransferase
VVQKGKSGGTAQQETIMQQSILALCPSPARARRAAAALLAAGQYERAARLYARAGQLVQALELVEQVGRHWKG